MDIVRGKPCAMLAREWLVKNAHGKPCLHELIRTVIYMPVSLEQISQENIEW